jgi:hypothetical protein
MNYNERIQAMDANMNLAAWMIAGGPKSTDAATDRNGEHLRALKASRPTSTGLVSRLAAAIAGLRPSATPVDPACCPA